MTTPTKTPTAAPPNAPTSIAPDNALIINPRDLGITATGPELEKLFIEFCKKNSQNPWQFELSPEGKIITMPPVNYPGDAHEGALFLHLGNWAADQGGHARNSNAAFRMPHGGLLVPDASWTSDARWDEHPHPIGEPTPPLPRLRSRNPLHHRQPRPPPSQNALVHPKRRPPRLANRPPQPPRPNLPPRPNRTRNPRKPNHPIRRNHPPRLHL